MEEFSVPALSFGQYLRFALSGAVFFAAVALLTYDAGTYLARQGIKLGVRVHTGPAKGELEWRRANRPTLQQMIHNPTTRPMPGSTPTGGAPRIRADGDPGTAAREGS